MEGEEGDLSPNEASILGILGLPQTRGQVRAIEDVPQFRDFFSPPKPDPMQLPPREREDLRDIAKRDEEVLDALAKLITEDMRPPFFAQRRGERESFNETAPAPPLSPREAFQAQRAGERESFQTITPNPVEEEETTPPEPPDPPDVDEGGPDPDL